jgi:hypothetical protein
MRDRIFRVTVENGPPAACLAIVSHECRIAHLATSPYSGSLGCSFRLFRKAILSVFTGLGRKDHVEELIAQGIWANTNSLRVTVAGVDVKFS